MKTLLYFLLLHFFAPKKTFLYLSLSSSKVSSSRREIDDVEDLLTSIEAELKNPVATTTNSTTKTSSKSTSYSSTSSTSIIDSLLDLTNDVDSSEGYKRKGAGGSGSRPTPQVNNLGRGGGSRTMSASIVAPTDPRLGEEKCKNVYLGDDSGVSSYGSSRSMPCLKLRCTACDFNVLRFVGQSWLESADYLFFRNNFPDQVKLSKCLDLAAKGTTSYCCQCSWLTLEKAALLSSPSASLPVGQAGAVEGLLMIRRGAIALSGAPSIERELFRSGTKLKVIGGTISGSTSFSSWVCGHF